jgi:hypothetical protein
MKDTTAGKGAKTMKDGFKEALGKAITAKESFPEYSTITINNNWEIDVYVHPSESHVHLAVAAFTKLIGKLEKRQESYGTAFEFTGSNDNVNVRIITPEQCKIVGYKIEKRIKNVVVQSNEIEEVKTPVTDCDIKSGKVKIGDFETLIEEGEPCSTMTVIEQ